MTQRTYRFILQAQDPDHGCPVLERRIVVSDLEELHAVLGSIADDDPALEHEYTLDFCDLAQMAQRLGITFDWNRGEVWLAPWRNARNIPYLIHTGYELALMLEGRKPFCLFC
jgi:hypothetical protein